MSWRLMERVCDLALPNNEFRILMLLARRANDDGTGAFPSVARLVSESGNAERTVRYTLRSLEAGGWITAVAYRRGGRGHATEYRITLPPTASQNGANSAPFAS